ncbi:MAG: hypothetical protein M2R45_02331 [Verrucomicrobia subdivision 3 bacterium]|nr:hypothetical protein [Limisphaerales bacterium]MCS1414710.1 hypothetical protein [Limisphaerales bacterium]
MPASRFWPVQVGHSVRVIRAGKKHRRDQYSRPDRNIVKSGGQAQSAYCDYHLGFQSDETTRKFPIHAQVTSQYLTPQGVLIHKDMPVASGPTQLLPYSHRYQLGHLAFRDSNFAHYFAEHRAQLSLTKEDIVFFNPTLSTTDRIGNLVPLSSAFGRTLEIINRFKIIEAVYPVLLQQRQQSETLSALAARHHCCACRRLRLPD